MEALSKDCNVPTSVTEEDPASTRLEVANTLGLTYITEEAERFAMTSEIPEVQQRRRVLMEIELRIKQRRLLADRGMTTA